VDTRVGWIKGVEAFEVQRNLLQGSVRASSAQRHIIYGGTGQRRRSASECKAYVWPRGGIVHRKCFGDTVGSGKWRTAARRPTMIPGIAPRFDCGNSLTTDISHSAQFDRYAPVNFYGRQAAFQSERKCIGRRLGGAGNYSDLSASYILKANEAVIVRKDVWGTPANELAGE
jgi:hypothetical protein